MSLRGDELMRGAMAFPRTMIDPVRLRPISLPTFCLSPCHGQPQHTHSDSLAFCTAFGLPLAAYHLDHRRLSAKCSHDVNHRTSCFQVGQGSFGLRRHACAVASQHRCMNLVFGRLIGSCIRHCPDLRLLLHLPTSSILLNAKLSITPTFPLALE